MDGFTPLVVEGVEPLTDDAVAVTFTVPTTLAGQFAHRPGQHVTLRRLGAGAEQRRTYSVCSPALGDRPRLRIGVRRLPGGAVSPWLCDEVRPGDRVEVAPPSGSFGPRLSSEQPRRYGLVAAGSGITPLLSIAASVLEGEPGSEVALVYGNRTAASAMFVEDLADLKDRFPHRLAVHHLLSREQQVSPVLSGRLDRARMELLLHGLLPVADIDCWYVCGPLGVVEATREALAAAGVDPAGVHAELFYAGPPAAAAAAAAGATPSAPPGAADPVTVGVTLHGRRSEVTVARDGPPVLDAVLAVRPDAPYACRGGVCGTCRAWLRTGEVRLERNYALEADELTAGVVLTCQAHPLTDGVELEFC